MGVTCEANEYAWLEESVCSRLQVQDLIARQILVLRTWLLQVMRGLQEHRLGTELLRWFGDNSAETRSLLQQTLEIIYDSFDYVKLDFFPGFAGYARIHQYNMVGCIARQLCTIELGALFFEDSGVLILGEDGVPADSRGGTLFHEMTHLLKANRIPIQGDWSKEEEGQRQDGGKLGASDYQYGREPCKRLAVNSSRDARHNADNYNFFLEDCVMSERAAAHAVPVGLHGQLGDAITKNHMTLPHGYSHPIRQICSKLKASGCTNGCRDKRAECFACGASCPSPKEPIARSTSTMWKISFEAVYFKVYDAAGEVFILKQPKKKTKVPSFIREKDAAALLSEVHGVCKVVAVDPLTDDEQAIGASGSLLLEPSLGSLVKAKRFYSSIASRNFKDMIEQMVNILRGVHRKGVAHGRIITPKSSGGHVVLENMFECISNLCENLCLGNFDLGVTGSLPELSLESLGTIFPEWFRPPELREESDSIPKEQIMVSDWYSIGIILHQAILGESKLRGISLSADQFRLSVASMVSELFVGKQDLDVVPLLMTGLLEEVSHRRLNLDNVGMLSHDIYTGIGSHSGVCEHFGSVYLTKQIELTLSCTPQHQVLDSWPFLELSCHCSALGDSEKEAFAEMLEDGDFRQYFLGSPLSQAESSAESVALKPCFSCLADPEVDNGHTLKCTQHICP